MVGRERELERARHALAQPGGVLLVAGEAGAGKTRLVRELLVREGRLNLVGHCPRLRQSLPLGPLVEALAGAAGASARAVPPSPVTGALHHLLPELGPHLAAPLEPLPDARAERHRAFRGIVALLQVLGRTLLVLEDIHQIDPETDDFVRFLVMQMPADTRLVLTYRPEETGHLPLAGALASQVACERLSLQPLSPDQVAELIGEISGGGAIPEPAARHIHAQTRGVPALVEDVVRLLAADGPVSSQLVGPGTVAALGVPPSVRDGVRERLRRLGSTARRIAEAAAVLASPASQDLLVEVAGLGEAKGTRALMRALRLGLLRESQPGCYGLCHGLALQAVYQAMPRPDRRQLHRAAARALEARGEPLQLARIAHHLREGEEPEAAARFALAAADRALGAGDDATAYHLLRDLVEAGTLPGHAKAPAAVKLVTAAATMTRPAEGAAIARRLLAGEAMDAATRGQLRFQLGVLLMQAGDGDLGRHEMVRAMPDLTGEPALLTRALAAVGAVDLSPHGSPVAHDELLVHAIQAAELGGDRWLKADVLATRASSRLLSGVPAGTAGVPLLADRPTTVSQQRALGRACGTLAYACTWIGAADRAEEHCARASELAAASADASTAAAAERTAVSLAWTLGRWRGLDARAAAAASAAVEMPALEAEARLVRALLRLAGGDAEGAREGFARVYHLARQHGPVTVLAGAAAGTARVLLSRGALDEAADAVQIGLTALRRGGLWVLSADVAPVAVDVLVAREDVAGARELVDRLRRGVEGREAPAASAALAACRARVAEAEADLACAAAWSERAEAAWLRVPRPYPAARAREAHGLALTRDHPEAGREALLAALDQYSALGATWDAARCREALRSRGFSARRRSGRRGYGSTLSPREREVALLAASGLSNREIAGALFLSPRTVEEHVAKSLRKLGVKRGGLARLMSDLDTSA